MEKLFKNINYNFKNLAIVKEALSHPSKKDGSPISIFQRLEFLGDSILGFIIADILFSKFSMETEGELAGRKAALVCTETLAKIARRYKLGEFLTMAQNEDRSGGRDKDKNLENAFEALIAAIYIDGGIEEARKFILQAFGESIAQMATPPKDAKSTLQEWAQGNGKPIPTYTVIEVSGPSHKPLFTIEVSVESLQAVSASSTSKRKAEQEAAKLMLDKINEQ